MQSNLPNRLILVVDLESTCWEDKVDGLDRRQTVDDMEIIEFGCVVAKATGEIIDSKSFMVRPAKHPVLTDFCIKLTTITQADVDAAPQYLDVVKQINEWLAPYELTAWASWGDYDYRHIQAELHRHSRAPGFMKLPYFNLRKLWKKNSVPDAPKKVRRGGIRTALKYHGLEFEGCQHRGIDDALNIAKLIPFIDFDKA